MYAVAPLGGPDLAPQADTEPRRLTTQAVIDTTKTVVNKAVSIATSTTARFIYRLAITTVVAGVMVSFALALHTVVRSFQLMVNAVSFALWWVTIMNFLQAKVLSYNATAKQEPRLLHIDVSTSSWCSEDAVKAVWTWTGQLA